MSGTRQGTSPAALASPASQANDRIEPSALPLRVRPAIDIDAATPIRRFGLAALEGGPDDTGEDAEISAIFRRMLSGLRRRRPEERAAALRAARNWLWQARKALREKREAAARQRWMRRRNQAPGPS